MEARGAAAPKAQVPPSPEAAVYTIPIVIFRWSELDFCVDPLNYGYWLFDIEPTLGRTPGTTENTIAMLEAVDLRWTLGVNNSNGKPCLHTSSNPSRRLELFT